MNQQKLSIATVLKLFSAMGATRKELVKEFIMLLVNKEYANRWRDPSWVLPATTIRSRHCPFLLSEEVDDPFYGAEGGRRP